MTLLGSFAVASLLLSSLFIGASLNVVRCDDRASLIYGVDIWQSEYETQLCVNVTDQIEYQFSQISDYDWIQNHFADQYADMPGDLPYCEDYEDFATVFYKGHAMICFEGGPWKNYLIYSEAGSWYYPLAWDFEVGGTTKFYFEFFWACMCGNEYGSWTQYYGFPANWFSSDEAPNNKCFLGFNWVSKNFEEYTGYSSYEYADFAEAFYTYLTQGYSVYDSLYQAAVDTLGSMNHELFTGYYAYLYDEQWWSYLTWYGDSTVTVT
jgi:hypothetical protein